MTPRTVESARRGLPGTLYGLVATVDAPRESAWNTDDDHEIETDEGVVGMGRYLE